MATTIYAGFGRGSGGYYRTTDGSGPYMIDAFGNALLPGLDLLIATLGEYFPDDVPTVYSYTGNSLISITKTTPAGSVFVKTITWSGGNLQSSTGWVKQ